MKHLTALFSLFTLVLSLLIVPVQVSAATQIDIPGPLGSERFGQIVTALPNGNIVITDPFYDAPGPISNVGAAYLYNGAGALISTLTGTTANDSVGNFGVTALTNGNYVVRSTNWGATDFGAVTWGDGTSGISGVVSSANSLVGSAASDFVGGGGVTALTNGNYVVNSRNWDATDFGAVTWGSGTSGISGVVSAANSLTGSAANDLVGNNGITALTNGNYVVRSTSWGASDFGAVTWGSGTGGISGVVSSANSLTGSTTSDFVGNNGVTALTNGNYVVSSSSWDGAAVNVGAATWGSGTSGISGLVSAANSLTGSATGDVVGNGGVTALTNGNYVVSSTNWGAAFFGAATWGSGTSGISGVVSAANSLVGSTANDNVGNGFVTALPNGNYVVSSTAWGSTDFGAVTWGSGTSGISGVVASANSLVGSTANDVVGNNGVTALTNGNYVVLSTGWDGVAIDSGAISYGPGNGGTVGAITVDNSVRGTASGGGGNLNFSFDTANNQLVVGRSLDNIVTLFRLSPTAAEASVSGRVLTANGRGLRNARVTITDGNGNSRNAVTSSFGYYEFTGVAAGESYVVAVTSKLYRYAPRAVSVQDDVTDMDFTPETTERKTR